MRLPIADLVDLHDIRMIEPGDRLGLAPQARTSSSLTLSARSVFNATGLPRSS